METIRGAALVIFGFNRIDEFKVMWNGVLGAENCYDRSLYIFIDGPKNHRDNDVSVDLLKIVEDDVSRFLTSEVIVRKDNLGLKVNIENGLDYVFSKEKAAIILEDDIVIAKSAFLYVDKMLTIFDKEQFGAISLYQYPSDFQREYSYSCSMYSCWGWATTAIRWNNYREYVGPKLSLRWDSWLSFNQGIYATYLEQLIANKRGLLHTWFIHWYFYNFCNRLPCIYPAKSLAKNIGFNENGSNCEVATSEYDVDFWDELHFEIRKVDGRPYSRFFKQLRMNRYGLISLLRRYLKLYLWV